jgi:hypothetical protein
MNHSPLTKAAVAQHVPLKTMRENVMKQYPRTCLALADFFYLQDLCVRNEVNRLAMRKRAADLLLLASSVRDHFDRKEARLAVRFALVVWKKRRAAAR